jgi:hypothetical protein
MFLFLKAKNGVYRFWSTTQDVVVYQDNIVFWESQGI